MIKKGTNVKILTGKDKNKDGEIIEIDRSNNRAKVKGINMIKKHVKTTKEKKGGIVDKENFIHISNLIEITEKTKKKLVNVFIPTTPNPTSGFLLMFPKEEVIYLDLTFEEASKFIVSAGTSNPG